MRRSRIVGPRVVDERPQLARGTARGPSWPASTRPRACRGRRASSAGSRRSCWPCAACPGAASSACERARSRRRSPRGGVGVASPARQVVAALGERGHRAEVSVTNVSNTSWSRASSRVRSRGGRGAGLKYLVALAGLLALARRTGRRAPDDVLQPLAGPGSSVLKSWSRSTGAVRVVGADRAAVVDLVAVVRPGLERDVAVGDARQRGRADRRPWCPRAAARSRRRPSSLTSACPLSSS